MISYSIDTAVFKLVNNVLILIVVEDDLVQVMLDLKKTGELKS